MQGMELIGQTIFAEGAEGTLQKNYLKFNLREGKDPQTSL